MTRSAWNISGVLALAVPLIVALEATETHAAVTISGAPTANMTCAAGVCAPTAPDAVLNGGDLKTMLASGSVTVESGSTAQDIVTVAPLHWTSGITLTLDAFRSLTIKGPISVKGTGGLTILTNDGGTGGVYSIGGRGHVTFAHLSSPLTINGHAYKLANNLSTLVANITANPAGFHALANSYDAGGDGTYSGAVIAPTFSGTFDGLGNAVSNTKIVGGADMGFFFEVLGTVQHVNLRQINLGGNSAGSVGGLAYFTNDATLYEDTVTGSAAGGIVGGLAGQTQGGTVRSCYAAVAVTGGGNLEFVGGLIGLTSGTTVSTSFATGSVTANASHSVAGGLMALPWALMRAPSTPPMRPARSPSAIPAAPWVA